MDHFDYLCQDEVTQLNHTFEISLQHDSALVFWTGISPELAKDWARKNDLKTLTMAMGSLYTDKEQGSLRSSKSIKSWSKYMKGASGVFAQHACQHGYAVVLTNAPPDIYSKREHSNYRDIEEPILKGLNASQQPMRIDYVHPTVPGAASFRYQVWPDDQSSEWFGFLQCNTVKAIVNKIVSCTGLQQLKAIKGSEATTSLHPEPQVSIAVTTSVGVDGNAKQGTAEEKSAAKQCKAEKEQQAARERKAANRRKTQREQQAAREREAANLRKAEREKQAVKRCKAEKKQQAAEEKKEAKRVKAEAEQKAAQEKKEAKRREAEKKQLAAKKKKIAKRLKTEAEKKEARDKKAAKRLKKKAKKKAKKEKKAAKLLTTGSERNASSAH